VLTAQHRTENKHPSKIGVSFSTALGNDKIPYIKEIKASPLGFKTGSFYTFGLNYIFGLNKHIELETGFEYSRHNITTTVYSHDLVTPLETHKDRFYLINIPLTARVNFADYLFINGGLLLDFINGKNTAIRNRNAIGAIIGGGIKYDFDFNISVFCNPYFKWHTVIPFSQTIGNEKITESGIRFGIMYKIN